MERRLHDAASLLPPTASGLDGYPLWAVSGTKAHSLAYPAGFIFGGRQAPYQERGPKTRTWAAMSGDSAMLRGLAAKQRPQSLPDLDVDQVESEGVCIRTTTDDIVTAELSGLSGHTAILARKQPHSPRTLFMESRKARLERDRAQKEAMDAWLREWRERRKAEKEREKRVLAANYARLEELAFSRQRRARRASMSPLSPNYSPVPMETVLHRRGPISPPVTAESFRRAASIQSKAKLPVIQKVPETKAEQRRRREIQKGVSIRKEREAMFEAARLRRKEDKWYHKFWNMSDTELRRQCRAENFRYFLQFRINYAGEDERVRGRAC